mgnify:CR=1 FL=1
MIQDIAPHRYDNAYHPTQPKDGDRVFFYQDGSTLLSRESGLPFTWEEANACADLSALPCTYFFSIDDIAFHWCHVVPSAILDAAVPAKNGQFRDMQPGWLAFACITASCMTGTTTTSSAAGAALRPSRTPWSAPCVVPPAAVWSIPPSPRR